MSKTLRKALFDEYGGFADKRVKDLDRDAPFQIDDRDHGGLDAQGVPFHWFCTMQVLVAGNNMFDLRMGGTVLSDANVETLVASKSGSVTKKSLSIRLDTNDAPFLRNLANATEPLEKTASGKERSRTADSLRRLADLLTKSQAPLAQAGTPTPPPPPPKQPSLF